MGIEKITYPVEDDFFKLEVWNNNIKAIAEQFRTDENRLTAVEKKAGTNATNIGTLSNLTTTEKTSLVKAVNEVGKKASDNTTRLTNVEKKSDANATNIGTLSNLTTTEKTSLVKAVNEVNKYKVGINLCKKDYYEINTIPYEHNDIKKETIKDDTRFSKQYFKITILKEKSTRAQKGFFFRFFSITNDLKKGEPVSISFYVKCSREVQFSNLGLENVLSKSMSIGTEWQKIEIVQKSNPIDNNGSFTLLFYSPSSEILEKGLEYYVSDIKIEKGTIPTDWTPAPEDLLPVDGNAVSASKLQTARNIALTGAVKGNVNFDGSGNVSIETYLSNGGSITGDTDWNTLTTEGTYKIQRATISSENNFPTGETQVYGILFVAKCRDDEARLVQLYFPNTDQNKYAIWIRFRGSALANTWTAWVGLKNYDSIIGTLSDLSTTAKTNLVGAINELKTITEQMGEQFSTTFLKAGSIGAIGKNINVEGNIESINTITTDMTDGGSEGFIVRKNANELNITEKTIASHQDTDTYYMLEQSGSRLLIGDTDGDIKFKSGVTGSDLTVDNLTVTEGITIPFKEYTVTLDSIAQSVSGVIIDDIKANIVLNKFLHIQGLFHTGSAGKTISSNEVLFSITLPVTPSFLYGNNTNSSYGIRHVTIGDENTILPLSLCRDSGNGLKIKSLKTLTTIEGEYFSINMFVRVYK